MTNVLLVTVNHQLEVRCADCGAYLDTVLDQRMAMARAGQYAAHRCEDQEDTKNLC